MKKTYRNKSVDEYWEERWINAKVDKDKFENMNIYPIKYAEIIAGKCNKILEAGCGSGRVYFHYKNEGKNIRAFDYSESAVNNILLKEPNAQVICANILELPYKDNEFDGILAFGLYHGIENVNDIEIAFKETARVLKKGGYIVFSVRADNIENNIIEYKTRQKAKEKEFNKFHKWQFDLKDLKDFTDKSGLSIEKYYYVKNVSFLFKFDIFRHKSMKKKNFNESLARSKGFRLNIIGKLIDKFLHTVFPKQFSNLIVCIAHK